MRHAAHYPTFLRTRGRLWTTLNIQSVLDRDSKESLSSSGVFHVNYCEFVSMLVQLVPS